jgi:hypothetical protein
MLPVAQPCNPEEELCDACLIKVSAQNRHKQPTKPFVSICRECVEIKDQLK